MIPFISIALAVFEAQSLLRHKPTVTELSHHWPEGILVWSWLVVLAMHFARPDGK
jgi:hypothetical protein